MNLEWPVKVNKEIPQNFDPMWFGGLIEVAGSVILTVGTENRNGRQYIKVTPIITMKDNDWGRIKKLEEYAGGLARHISPIESSPYQWAARGYYAVELARLVKPYAPSRQEAFTAFENWANEDEPEQREEIARELQSIEGGRNEILEYDYRQLVTQSNFVAGVVDARGGFYNKNIPYAGDNLPYHDWVIPRLETHSQNQPLLEALHEKWGGVVDRWDWIVGKETGLMPLIEFIAPELKLRSIEPK